MMFAGCDSEAGAADKEFTGKSNKDLCRYSDEDETDKNTSVKYQPDSTNNKNGEKHLIQLSVAFLQNLDHYKYAFSCQ